MSEVQIENNKNLHENNLKVLRLLTIYYFSVDHL
jgi:hypothetical protein